jgi:hypothetical protein
MNLNYPLKIYDIDLEISFEYTRGQEATFSDPGWPDEILITGVIHKGDNIIELVDDVMDEIKEGIWAMLHEEQYNKEY